VVERQAPQLGHVVRSMQLLARRAQQCASDDVVTREYGNAQSQAASQKLVARIEEAIQTSRNEIEELRQASTRQTTRANLRLKESVVESLLTRYADLEESVTALERGDENVGGEVQRRGVLIVTALPLEARAVRAELGLDCEAVSSAGSTFDRAQLPSADGKAFPVRLITAGELNVSSAIETTLEILACKPQFTFFVGVAGAVPDVTSPDTTLRLGDVVISSKIYGQAGVLRASELELRPIPCNVSKNLLRIGLKVASSYGSGGSVTGGNDVPCGDFAIHVKPILSSDYLIKSRDNPIFQRLQSSFPDAYAVDQEALGFGYASNNLGVEAIAVRGISDNLAGKNATSDQHWQPRAASNAAKVVARMLGELMSRQNDGGPR